MLDLLSPIIHPVRRLSCDLARTQSEMEEAQRIRFKVFGEEMGAKLPSAASGLDVDRFDMFCEHLLVRDHGNNKVVGTYRILPPEQARKAGGYYSETEFDMTRLAHLREIMAPACSIKFINVTRHLANIASPLTAVCRWSRSIRIWKSSSRRSSKDICAWVLISPVNRPGTLNSTAPICSSCCRWLVSMHASQNTL